MPRIIVEYFDGSQDVFEETSRPGGSYCTTGKAEMGWYIVTDAYGTQTSIPAEKIKKVTTTPSRSW